MMGEYYDIKPINGFYSAMCKDILKENKIRGDWVVIHAVNTNELRQHIRQELGPNLILMVLNMTKEEQIQSVFGRHRQPGELTAMLINVFDSYKAVNLEKGRNTIGVLLTRDVTQEGVGKKCLQISIKMKNSFLYYIRVK